MNDILNGNQGERRAERNDLTLVEGRMISVLTNIGCGRFETKSVEIHRQTKPGVSYFQPGVKTRPKDIPVYLAVPGTERKRERERESFVLEECNEEDVW